MKIQILSVVLMAFIANNLEAQSTASQSQVTVPAPTPYTIVIQDANTRVWQRQEYETGPNGVIVTNTRSYTELATGLNHLVDGQFAASSEQIDILSDGSAEATQGQHQVYFPADILTGNIRSIGPDGFQLSSQPSALVEYDGTNTAFIAILTNSIGQVIADNQLIYTNAFEGIRCDILYSYTKAGFEQNIVLRQRVPDPASLGLNPETTRLQFLTEFINTRQPNVTGNSVSEQAGVTLTDEELSFGVMRMVQGKAFVLPSGTPTALVSKSWMAAGSRQFLVEEVPFMAIAAQLQVLSASAAKPGHALWASKERHKLVLPPRHFAKMAKARLTLAKVDPLKQSGVMLDYQTVNTSQTNYIFRGDTTYYISGGLWLYGTNTLEGGAVIKFTNNAALTFQAIVTKTRPYCPAILTSKDDNSVGESISGSTGSPTNFYASTAISLGTSLTALNDLRICYAATAIAGAGTINLTNVQMVNCRYGISLNGSYESLNANLYNVLMANVNTNFNLVELVDASASICAQNCTFANPTVGVNYEMFTLGSFVSYSASLTNCVLANINTTAYSGHLGGAFNGIYPGNYNDFGNANVPTYTYPFQAVGAGDYYLTTGSGFQGVGTTNIDPNLLASLSQRTTWPPLVLTNSPSTTLTPQVQRDNTGLPDIGYHYDPIDYAANTGISGTLTLSNGVVVAGYGNNCLNLAEGAQINSQGNPVHRNYLVYYNSVQEQPKAWGSSLSDLIQLGEYDTLSFRFTDFISLEHSAYYMSGYQPQSASMRDCEVYSGAITLSTLSSLGIMNNLFCRANMAAYYAGNLSLQQNLFWNGSMDFETTSSSYLVFNNSFDGTAITSLTSPVVFNNNAFINANYSNMSNGNLALTNFVYTAGPLGSFYQLSTNLIEKGSTNANLLGMYHYTTQTNQIVDGTNIVTIGYHYVATDEWGNPLDTNGDGIPDYLEDANGDGIFDAGDLGNWSETPGKCGFITFPNGQTILVAEPKPASAIP